MIKETFFSFLHYISELGAHYVEGPFLNQWSIINQSLRGILSAGLLIGKEGLDQTASFIPGHGVTSFLSFYLWPINTLISIFCESESHSVVSDSLQLHWLYGPWNSPGQNTGVGSCSLLQGIFPTQGSNPGLLHCRRILYHLSHQGSPRILEWGAYPFSSGSPWPRNWTGVSCIAGWFISCEYEPINSGQPALQVPIKCGQYKQWHKW